MDLRKLFPSPVEVHDGKCHPEMPAHVDFVPHSHDKPDAHIVAWERVDLPKFFACISVLAVCEGLSWYPIQVIKSNLQVNLTSETRGLFRGSVYVARRLYKAQGIRAFFNGASVDLASAVPLCMLYYTVLNSSKNLFEGSGDYTQGYKWWTPFAAGCAADLCTSFFAVPFGIVALRLQCRESRYSGSVTKAFSTIWKEEGLRGFYRGLTATVIRDVPASGMWWGTYEAVKPHIARITEDRYKRVKARVDLTGEGPLSDARRVWWASDRRSQFISGSVAGVVTTILINPLDVLKTRLQVLYHGTNVVAPTIREESATIWRTEGLAGFMRGVAPKAITYAPLFALGGVMYEIVMALSERKDAPAAAASGGGVGAGLGMGVEGARRMANAGPA